ALMPNQIIEADWTWTGHALESGVQVDVGSGGLIERVGALGATPTERLRNQALFPGMINVHSHAFQRGLRGKGERFPAGMGSFWSWREAMYALVEELDPEPFKRICIQAFREMLACGTTTVGEFHYFHHTRGTSDYAFDRLIIEAAREAGIRMVLLQTYYRTGGVGQPLIGGQRRFATADPAEYWASVDRLAPLLDPATQSLGAVAHSIRAAAPDEIAALHAESVKRGMVFHIHVEEQRKEIEDTVAAYRLPPMALITRAIADVSNVTAVHCTHTDPLDMDRYLEAGGRVCLCPLTEGNLGDGIPDLSPVHAAGGRMALGSDSNNRIAMFEDMRWLEYGQRLADETRGELRPEDGRLSRTLFEIATIGGADSLRIPAGAVEPGKVADFFTVDLSAPALAGCEADSLLDGMIFGADSSVVQATCVGGRWVHQR
ncbi:MAG: formimidoylglutamate deiminase, partial [Gemmatimonadota bacterium]